MLVSVWFLLKSNPFVSLIIVCACAPKRGGCKVYRLSIGVMTDPWGRLSKLFVKTSRINLKKQSFKALKSMANTT